MFKLSILFFVAGCAVAPPDESVTTAALVDARFKVQGLAGKCIALDTKINRLVLRTCNDKSADQAIRVVEDADQRRVELKIYDQCVQPILGFPITGIQLETVSCDKRSAQFWLLDGDSIRLAPQKVDPFPDLFIAVGNHSGADGSPLTLVNRRLDESDYWEFTGIERGAIYPTSGFVDVADEAELIAALASATPGTVVQIDPDAEFELHECSLGVGPRVTVRSGRKNAGRRDIHPGAGAHLKYRAPATCDDTEGHVAAFFATGDGARFTGIELEGLGDDSSVRTYGVLMGTKPELYDYYACGTEQLVRPFRIDVDHMNLSGWKEGAVGVWGAEDEDLPEELCRCERPTEAPSGVVSRNYIHHNSDPDGYGVSVTQDGHGWIIGNTFLHNRHAISATGTSSASYWAHGNLVHSHGQGHEQDFDIHGSGDGCGGDRGGVAGETIEISWNTFLGNNRNNFYIRGTPCDGAVFAHNVTRQQEEDGYTEFEGHSQAVRECDCQSTGSGFDICFGVANLDQHDNRYEIDDPTRQLAIHDFNGDGHDDVFMATGAAFYVSFSGQSAWQYRALGKELMKDLAFGDFDGDGRTDVLRNGPTWNGVQILFGGEGDWSPLQPDVALGNLLVGDFDGNGRDDLIHTNGTKWLLSDGGTGAWMEVRSETRRANEFRVGLIDFDNRDDVFGIFPGCGGAGCFAFFLNGTGGVINMGTARAPISELSIADVDGNGMGDVVRAEHVTWVTYPSVVHYEWRLSVSWLGNSAFDVWATSEKPGGVGHFDGASNAVALVWKSLTWRSQKFGAASEYLAWWEMF